MYVDGLDKSNRLYREIIDFFLHKLSIKVHSLWVLVINDITQGLIFSYEI